MDVGGDEIFIFVLAIGITLWFLIRWYAYIAGARSFKPLAAKKATLAFMPLISAALILIVLIFWAAPDVVGFYRVFYVVLGFPWIYLGILLMFLTLNLSWIDDILNHNNKASFGTIIGCILSFTLIYAGSNVGDGPGWWCVVFSALLGFALWTVLAVILNLTTKLSYRVTVERDGAAGFRYACYFIAIGIIIGRACAGDWLSAGATVADFLYAWPAAILTAAAIGIEQFFIHKTDNDGIEALSALAGLLYLGAAAASLILLPELSINQLR
ncbi:MAG: hypothetical protein FWD58_03585 [Firmicutes bacterium]|nr:hypothetical protein [Bacillota bacterium]